jgi:hypothetical protein
VLAWQDRNREDKEQEEEQVHGPRVGSIINQFHSNLLAVCLFSPPSFIRVSLNKGKGTVGSECGYSIKSDSVWTIEGGKSCGLSRHDMMK